MTDAIVIRANLQASVTAAALHPEEANLEYLCHLLDHATAPLDSANQLLIAGDILSQIIEIFYQRSHLLFDELQATLSVRDPVVPRDLFRQLTRQSMQVDFAALIQRDSTPTRKEQTQNPLPVETMTVDTFMATLPATPELDSTFDSMADIKELASVEDIAGWSAAIASVMVTDQTTLVSLQTQLPLSLIEIWLGLLLGGYSLAVIGDHFYSSDCLIHRPSSHCQNQST